MENAKKVTKTELFEQVKEIVLASDVENVDELVEFINHEVELIAAKAEKAKARKEANKAKGDALKAAVAAALTEEFQTAEAITAVVAPQFNDEEITKSKVVARLTALVKEEVAVKEEAKVDKRRIMTYKLA